MNTAALVNDAIVQEITIKAPAARIFQALTNPEELLKWWGAPGKFQAVHVESDLRPGGTWLMRVSGSCGPETCTVVSGRYQEVRPPRLLTFTWIREHENEPETLVRWDLAENAGVTRVRLTHSGLVNERLHVRNSGWPLILNLLDAYVVRQMEAGALNDNS